MICARLISLRGRTQLRFAAVSALRNTVGHLCPSFSTSAKKSDNTWTLPNIITCTRIAASPLLAAAVVYDMKGIALTGCVLAGISDWADGYIARKYNQSTILGKFLDPIADKVFMCSMMVGLTLHGQIPMWLCSVVIFRDVALIAGCFVIRAMHLRGKHGLPFFDFSENASFEITPSTLSKINTACQFALVGASLSNFLWGLPAAELLEPVYYITATTTIASGIDYMRGSGVSLRNKS